MLAYARLEIRRQLRNRHALFFRIALPAALFVVFRAALVEDKPSGDLPPDADAMVVFAVLGTLLSGVFATGPSLAQERATGWLHQLRVTPLPLPAIVAAKVAAAMVFALPSVGLVLLAATATQGVAFGCGTWAALTLVLWIGAVPFAALGVAIGLAVEDPDTAQGVAGAAIIALWIFGGMLGEPSDLPATLERLAGALPTTGAAELGWAVVRGEALPRGAIGALLLWTVVPSALASLAWRRLGEAR